MKKIIVALLIILMLPSYAFSEVEIIIDSVLEEQIDKIVDTGEIDIFLKELLSENEFQFGDSAKDIILKVIKGEQVVDGKSIIESISKIFFSELRFSLNLLSKVLIITLISTILTNLQNSFEESSISQLANYFTYILIGVLVIANFSELMDMAKSSVGRMVDFMQVLLPILLTLLVVTGGPTAKIMFHPMILGTVNVLGIMVNSMIFPLIYFSFIVSILSNLSQRAELGKLADLGRQIITFIITATFTIFIGILTIYGLSTKIDGLSIRTAKFAVDTFVPIVGGFLSDAVDTVIGSSAILKNGIGIIGLLVLVMIILLPIIKVTVLLLVYSIIGAVIEPIASSNIIKFFGDASKTLLLVLISLVAIGIMFFITITITVDTGNNLMMLR
ncbi:MAG: stage III sporulation protein AE [Tissierellaceae bacterium]|nr:stage III sporulation protein AE [Tissierellaceae bacterium]